MLSAGQNKANLILVSGGKHIIDKLIKMCKVQKYLVLNLQELLY